MRKVEAALQAALLTCGAAMDGMVKVVAAVVAVAWAMASGEAVRLLSAAGAPPLDGPIASIGRTRPSVRNMCFPKDLGC
jgi:hypothetical protein